MSNDKHNDGQEDAANGDYNPPHSHLEEVFTWTSEGLNEIREDREQYQKGRDNYKSQKK